MSRQVGMATVLGVLMLAGCNHCQRNRACPDGGGYPPGPVGGSLPGPLAPGGGLPPPAPPGGSFGMPPPAPPSPSPPPPAPPDVRGSSPAPGAGEDGTWRPPGSSPNVQLGMPEPIVYVGPGQHVRLYPPQTEQRPLPPARDPPATTDREPPLFPVGIPQFAAAKDRVTAGLRPMLDGLDWLKANGYRTVLHVRQTGEDDSTDRKQVETRGMKYVSLEVSPQLLTQRVVDEFNKVVADSAGHPLFVYDRTGALAGGLWYVHFRTVENVPDEPARVRASALGLREDGEGAHRQMWQAVQQFLGTTPPKQF